MKDKVMSLFAFTLEVWPTRFIW